MNCLALAVAAALLLTACGEDSQPSPMPVDPAAAVLERAAPTGGCLSNCGPPADDFFDTTKLATLRLNFDPAHLGALGFSSDQWLDLLWSKWKFCNSSYTWLPASLEYESADGNGNVTMQRVGVRLRGSKSRGTNPVQGMKIEFKKLIPEPLAGEQDRRFADLNQINLLSVEKDKSVMLQCMSYQLMRDNGVPAPRCNHLQVVVNGEPYGVMQSVEKTDDGRFLRHQFGDNDGSLFGGSTDCSLANPYGASLDYEGDIFAGEYLKSYEIVRGDRGHAESQLIPMFKCGDATTTPDDDEFKACIKDWIDVDEWLRVIAGESLISQLESFIGARRNVYLYFKPDATAPHAGRFLVWGWDYDTGLQRATCAPNAPGGIGCDPFTAVAKWFDLPGLRPRLVTRLTRVFRAEYCQIMQSFLSDVFDPERVDRTALVLERAMQKNLAPPYAEWEAEVAHVRDFMSKQRLAQQANLDAACSE
jgi:spore coat protein CotH